MPLTLSVPVSYQQPTSPSIYNSYKISHFVMRKWELIKQSQLLKIKSQILSNLFNEKYGLRLGEFKNTTGTERGKIPGGVVGATEHTPPLVKNPNW